MSGLNREPGRGAEIDNVFQTIKQKAFRGVDGVRPEVPFDIALQVRTRLEGTLVERAIDELGPDVLARLIEAGRDNIAIVTKYLEKISLIKFRRILRSLIEFLNREKNEEGNAVPYFRSQSRHAETFSDYPKGVQVDGLTMGGFLRDYYPFMHTKDLAVATGGHEDLSAVIKRLRIADVDEFLDTPMTELLEALDGI